MKDEQIIDVAGLNVRFSTEGEHFHAVKNLSFSLPKGKCLGIVGESGSGKSVSSLGLMGLLSSNAEIEAEKMWLFVDGEKTKLDSLYRDQWTKVRGVQIAMVFQEPMSSLNPVMTCGKQVGEAIRFHFGLSEKESVEKVLKLFEEVKLPDPERAYRAYPHELSGGQRQRVVIAMALSCDPELIIADEPTTALDVTVQKSIIELFRKLMLQRELSLIFITHDLGVVASIADDLAVMRNGEILEKGPVQEVLHQPKHPYTKGLIACRPLMNLRRNRLPTVQEMLKLEEQSEPDTSSRYRVVNESEVKERQEELSKKSDLIRVENLTVRFGRGQDAFTAVDDVSFHIKKGESLGLVGESGCGKSTLSRAMLGLIPISSGKLLYEDEVLLSPDQSIPTHFRKKAQLIFQDPMSSLNPGLTIAQTLAEVMKINGVGTSNQDRKERSADLLSRVNMDSNALHKYPHEFSGGQRQRIVIARALAVEPEFIICDESVAALDVSVQAQVLNLLMDLKDELALTYLFITHDFAVVNHFSDRIMVMNQGRIVESGWAGEIVQNPTQEYTRQLISSILEM